MTAETKTKAKKAPAKSGAKRAPAKKAAGGKTVTVRQTRSAARKPKEQEATLRGLGLGRIRRTRTLEDTPAVRGMIRAVQHLVEVVEESKS